MKEVFYNNSISSFLYSYIDNNVVIIPCGSESPFEHLNFINEVLSGICKGENLNIYFDFCLLNGFSDKRFLLVQYWDNKLDISSRRFISKNSIPKKIKAVYDEYFKINSEDEVEKLTLLKNIKFA